MVAALRMLEREAGITGALLDVELHGESVFPIAAMLQRKGIPFAFVMEQPARDIPFAFRHVASLPKSTHAGRALRLLRRDQDCGSLSVVDNPEKDRFAA
ncbi:response regulator [Sabulicella glaciei]|uniref:Transposase n=1 Tax=Sabulicella glaciei TaxID=2984948 RepID=A0ABT3P0V9_9PROT|nr:hypothetical protein [Roseococcus sp. MDT2-1-1]MCW8087818.1 hypothetical protein [Roseococcus sp. MDT2-1-1]